MDAKKNYYAHLVKNAQNIPKTTWKIINREVRVDNKSALDNNIYLTVEGNQCTDSNIICETFNEY